MPANERTVCYRCLREPEYLSHYIQSNATSRRCSYCGRVRRLLCAISLDDLMEVITSGVLEEYEDAADSVPYESAEGGYQLPTYTSNELLYELGIFSESEDLLNDIADALPDLAWADRDPFSLSRLDALRYGWEEFCRLVRHHTRFLFFKRKRGKWHSHDEIRPYEMLDALGSLVTELHLVLRIPKGTKLFRVRQHGPRLHPDSLVELGPPPADRARFANRLSPAGIPMLYTSLDPITAARETLNRRSKRLVRVTTGEICTLRPLKLLDLTNLPAVPSVFDPNANRERRHGIAFIRAFVLDLTRPVQKDGREHVEYVPSQVVTEYFRFKFRPPNGRKLDGIQYPSAVHLGGTNVVLFLNADDCSPTDPLGRRRRPPLKLASFSERALRGHP